MRPSPLDLAYQLISWMLCYFVWAGYCFGLVCFGNKGDEMVPAGPAGQPLCILRINIREKTFMSKNCCLTKLKEISPELKQILISDVCFCNAFKATTCNFSPTGTWMYDG